jgi:hypothetical protein
VVAADGEGAAVELADAEGWVGPVQRGDGRCLRDGHVGEYAEGADDHSGEHDPLQRHPTRADDDQLLQRAGAVVEVGGAHE